MQVAHRLSAKQSVSVSNTVNLSLFISSKEKKMAEFQYAAERLGLSNMCHCSKSIDYQHGAIVASNT